jgi:DNA-binding beta-propeller fold protein YncE
MKRMETVLALWMPFCLLACAASIAQQAPAPTELSGNPRSIKKTWIIGGAGDWDYMTVDPAANRLFIAHGPRVQAVDLDSGTLAGEIAGLHDVHAIALDDSGQFGYISDGAGQVIVFDRRSLRRVIDIAIDPNPRAVVFEPRTKLLFAVRTDPPDVNLNTAGGSRNNRTGGLRQPPIDMRGKSSVTVIDTQTQTALGRILFAGKLGYAQADGSGHVYINVTDRNQILSVDAEVVASLLRNREPSQPQAHPSAAAQEPARLINLDWSNVNSSSRPDGALHTLYLNSECTDPKGLAVDSTHQRLFAACNNMKMVVLDAGTGELVASLPTGPGTDSIAYDANRNLIYAANGGGYGSLTIVRQDAVTDSYAVIQILPTRQRARSMALNPATGEVYLVTDLAGVDLAQQGGIGSLKMIPVNGSFEVLVIGN